jgi:hypothetical protein
MVGWSKAHVNKVFKHDAVVEELKDYKSYRNVKYKSSRGALSVIFDADTVRSWTYKYDFDGDSTRGRLSLIIDDLNKKYGKPSIYPYRDGEEDERAWLINDSKRIILTIQLYSRVVLTGLAIPKDFKLYLPRYLSMPK